MKIRPLLLAAVIVSGIVAVAWFATGRELFTQQTRFVTVQRQPDPTDFMDVAQADENGLIHETVRRDGFWLGLAPSGYPRPGAWAPSATWLSVVTILAPLWAVVTVLILRTRRRNKKGPELVRAS